MPRLKEAGREADNGFANALFDMVFGAGVDPLKSDTPSGSPGDWWTVFNIVPDAFKHAVEGFAFYQSTDRKIAPKLRELGQIRAGYAVGSQFVYSQHCKTARQLGFSEEQIAAIPNWQVAECFDAQERAVLAYVDGLVLQHGRVSDATFAALKEHLSDEEILELSYITCTYMMHGIMSKALHLEFDNVPDRIVEVDAPNGNNVGVLGDA